MHIKDYNELVSTVPDDAVILVYSETEGSSKASFKSIMDRLDSLDSALSGLGNVSAIISRIESIEGRVTALEASVFNNP